MKKLKTWQFVLLIIFYPIGIIYFIVWLLNKNKADNSDAVEWIAQNENCTRFTYKSSRRYFFK